MGFSDRAIVLPCFAMAAASAILFFNFGLDGASGYLVYSVGSLVFLTSMQLGRGFVQSLSSKVLPASHKACFSTVWTLASRFGEAVGPLLASFLAQSSYAALTLGSLSLGLVLMLLSFRQLGAHDQAS